MDIDSTQLSPEGTSSNNADVALSGAGNDNGVLSADKDNQDNVEDEDIIVSDDVSSEGEDDTVEASEEEVSDEPVEVEVEVESK